LLACFLHLHARLRVRPTPGIPCALLFMRVKLTRQLGQIVPRECRFTSTPPSCPSLTGIQYSAASRFEHCCLWNTGSPGQAGDDNELLFDNCSGAVGTFAHPKQLRLDCAHDP
jgi:hypothetical protein